VGRGGGGGRGEGGGGVEGGGWNFIKFFISKFSLYINILFFHFYFRFIISIFLFFFFFYFSLGLVGAAVFWSGAGPRLAEKGSKKHVKKKKQVSPSYFCGVRGGHKTGCKDTWLQPGLYGGVFPRAVCLFPFVLVIADPFHLAICRDPLSNASSSNLIASHLWGGGRWAFRSHIPRGRRDIDQRFSAPLGE